MSQFNPGLIITHDVRNENYLIDNHTRKLGLTSPVAQFTPRKKLWKRAKWRDDQLKTARCTAFGPLISVGCTPITHAGMNPVLDPDYMYAENQAYDAAHGQPDGGIGAGATTISAMETLKAHGVIKGYYWGYTMDCLFRALAKGVVVAGTDWYPSMFDKDAQGVIRVNRNENPAGGHCYCLHGYDPKSDLISIAQSWGDGDYKIAAGDFYYLLRNGGEFTVFQEVKQ